ncbi:hypothetical protein [Mucilaginibacter sp.]
MIRSVIKKTNRIYFLGAIALLALPHYGFKPAMTEQEMVDWSNRCLNESYNPSGEAKLKKWELVFTNDAFIRLRKTYTNGKQEYYSFHLHRFTDMDYLGTTIGGTLQLKAKADDIIVQTYNDPHEDIDTMATQLNLPVKNMEPERLDSLQTMLNYFKNKEL